jgi:hypothetical protein
MRTNNTVYLYALDTVTIQIAHGKKPREFLYRSWLLAPLMGNTFRPQLYLIVLPKYAVSERGDGVL